MYITLILSVLQLPPQNNLGQAHDIYVAFKFGVYSMLLKKKQQKEKKNERAVKL